MGFLDTLPLTLGAVLAIVAVVFVIKSLIKFAIIAGAIAVLLWAAWQFDLLPFLAPSVR